MSNFLFIKGSEVNDVRMQKYFKYFQQKNIPAYFWGWDRFAKFSDLNDDRISYIFHGGGYASRKLIFYYIVWMIVLFFHTLFCRRIKQYNIVAVNFDAALPVFFASLIRRFNFSYEVLDEFSLSYNFPAFVKALTTRLDHLIMRHVKVVIHVDPNRLSYQKCNTIVIENSPFDFLKGEEKDYSKLEHSFAVTGFLGTTRCIDSIIQFARSCPEIKFIVAGKIKSDGIEKTLKSLPNISFHGFMDQDKLFELIQNCTGIFSLYRPDREINRLAASNKVYDAMMLGIPVITNPEVINSKFITDHQLGVVVNCDYDASWNKLSFPHFIQEAESLGRNGRNLYLEKYTFDKMIENIFIPAVTACSK